MSGKIETIATTITSRETSTENNHTINQKVSTHKINETHMEKTIIIIIDRAIKIVANLQQNLIFSGTLHPHGMIPKSRLLNLHNQFTTHPRLSLIYFHKIR